MGDRARYLRFAVVGIQLAVVVGCGILGWVVMHPAPVAPGISVHHAPPSVPRPVTVPVPAGRVLPPAGVPRPGSPLSVADLVQRVNRDDMRLYHGQWQAARLLGGATRDYLEIHIVPLLLAAAKGGRH